MTHRGPVRIANCSGFFGDRLSAAREMVCDGEIDFLTGDYLAELTSLILWKTQQRDGRGYAGTFLNQLEQVIAVCAERGIRVVANAGGLNPAGLATAVRELAQSLGLAVRVAHIEGDDLIGRLDELQARGESFEHLYTGRPLAELPNPPVTANAYLGAWGIVRALETGADIVICPRVTDASLVVGPAAWWFGWTRVEWDRLAGAVVAGHAIECGPQVTGGNYSFLDEVDFTKPPGFPLAEVYADGSAVITKHEGTGGTVSVGTVTAQLLYEIAAPAYGGPDVVAHFNTVQLTPIGPDRVEISHVRGSPPTGRYKVGINYLGGFRNSMTFVLTGLDIERKAELAQRTLLELVGGPDQLAELHSSLIRSDKPDATTNDEASAYLRISVKDQDPAKVGRSFANSVVEMLLASYAGCYTTTPPTDAKPYGVYWPTTVASPQIHEVVIDDAGVRHGVPAQLSSQAAHRAPEADAVLATAGPTPTWGETRFLPLGSAFGARSGDKGGNANLGVWSSSAAGYRWLAEFLNVDRLKSLLLEAERCRIERYEFPNIHSLNFVLVGFLGDGVAASVRSDPQAKSLAEYLRSRCVQLPVSLLDQDAVGSRHREPKAAAIPP